MRQIPTPAQAHEIVSVLNEELGADLDESVAARLAAGEDGIPFGGRHPDFAHGEDDSDGQSFFFYATSASTTTARPSLPARPTSAPSKATIA